MCWAACWLRLFGLKHQCHFRWASHTRRFWELTLSIIQTKQNWNSSACLTGLPFRSIILTINEMNLWVGYFQQSDYQCACEVCMCSVCVCVCVCVWESISPPEGSGVSLHPRFSVWCENRRVEQKVFLFLSPTAIATLKWINKKKFQSGSQRW